MVTTLGFSPSFGLLSLAGVPKELLGPDVQAGALSEARLLLEQAQATCQAEFCRHGEKLQALTDALLSQDVVSGAVLEGILGPVAARVREDVVLEAA